MTIAERSVVRINDVGRAARSVWLPERGTSGSKRMTVTPDMASAWLSRRCSHQRPVSRDNISSLTSQILNGQWRFDGSSIVFDSNGELIDGQHRCQAVIESSTPIDTLVVWGVDPSSYVTKDTGKSRTAADIIGLDNAKVVVTVARAAISMTRWSEPFNGGRRGSKISNGDVLECVRNDPDVVAAVNWVLATKERRSIGPNALTAVCYYLTAKVDRRMADEFWEGVAIGSNLSSNDPRLVFLRFLRNLGPAYSNMHRRTYVGCAIKTWNACRLHTGIRLLKLLNSEEFPLPV